jgi:hypothetical protein
MFIEEPNDPLCKPADFGKAKRPLDRGFVAQRFISRGMEAKTCARVSTRAIASLTLRHWTDDDVASNATQSPCSSPPLSLSQ